MTHDELASALVRHRIVHPDAVEYSEGYDNCETIANIIALHMELFPVETSHPPAITREYRDAAQHLKQEEEFRKITTETIAHE